MVIYLDLIILSTLIANYAFLKTISLIYKEKINIIRMIFSLILSVVMLGLFFLPYKTYFIIRYFMGIIIGIVAFKKEDFKNLIIKIIIFYILNMMFIGCLVVFKVKNIFIMILTVLYVSILYLIQTYQKYFKNDLIDIYINNDKLKGYLDTGNVSSYENNPIVYLKSIYFSNLYIFIDKIKIITVNGESYIDIYKGPPCIINKKTYDVYYAFSKYLTYDVILNKVMEDSI